MKHPLLTVIFCALPIFAAAEVESIRKLGFGFRMEVHAEASSSSFESITHQPYLYYGDKKLCNVGTYSIAPSGKFAIYQDGPSGNLFLFRRADQKVTQLTPKSIGFAESFAWHEADSTVEAGLEGNKKPKMFSLQ